MDNNIFTSYIVEDRTYVSFVKREIHRNLSQSNFTKNRIAEIDIIVSELTSNVIKHAGGGEILYRICDHDGASTLELITIDHGPGMIDVQKMMKDGTSTTNTLGHGLGAIQRMSTDFHLYSIPKWGTISYTTIKSSDEKTPGRSSDLEIRALCIPKPSENLCGDGYAVVRTKEDIRIFFGDGLGHGEFANEAIVQAKNFFLTCKDPEPVDIINQMHKQVRKTRGLVGSIAILNFKTRQWKLCGVGNINTRLYGGMMFKHYMAYNGIIGLNIPGSMKQSVVEAEKNQQLIMCSDGIRTRWELTKYPSILKHDAMILAASLYKDFNRRTDDSSVFIGKVILDK